MYNLTAYIFSIIIRKLFDNATALHNVLTPAKCLKMVGAELFNLSCLNKSSTFNSDC